MTKLNGDNVLESMGEVWFAVSEELSGVLIALTYVQQLLLQCQSVLFHLMFIGVAFEELRSISDSTQINPTQNIKRTTSESLKFLFY